MAYVGTYRALLAGGVARPALVLDFIGLNVLDPRITFSRGSNATLTDSTGRITYAPSNLLLRSQEFDNAAWGKQNGATVSADTTIAPDGTTTADTVTSGNGQTSSAIFQAQTLATNVTHTFSVYIRAGTASTASIGAFASGSFLSATASIVSGPGSVSGTGLINISGLSTTDWTRVRYTVTGTGVSTSLLIYPETTSTGTGKSVILWGAQLEPVTYQTTPSTYVATTSAAYYGPRFDYDPVTLAPKGLLIEEARTNLLTYSQDFDNAAWSKTDITVTANTIAAPDGTLTADLLTEGSANSAFISASATSSGPTVAASIYVKAGTATWLRLRITSSTNVINLWVNSATGGLGSNSVGGTGVYVSGSVSNVGSGWFRVSLVGSIPSVASYNFTVNSAAADGSSTRVSGATYYLWGAQLEAGAFATSYIPTVASTVTRSADVATMLGTNFSSWYNQSEGSFVSAFDMVGGSAVNPSNQIVLSAVTDASNRHLIYNGSSQITGYTVVGGVDQAYLTTGSLAANTTSKMSYAYQVNSFAASQNGGSVSTDTSGSLPSPASFGIGSSGYGTAYLNGHIRSIAYYNSRLPNATLQSLTA